MSMFYRAGVGAIILDATGNVLALERSDVPGAWQLPQGGIEQGEDPDSAVRREIREETGIDPAELEYLARYPEPLLYELPSGLQSPKTGLGQVQYWFLFHDRRTCPELTLPDHGEFRAWAWMPFGEVLSNVVEFRRRVYQHLANWLAQRFSSTV